MANTPESIQSAEVDAAIAAVREAAAERPLRTKVVRVEGADRVVPYPFPSPEDWRDQWIYFLLIDRFDNPAGPPRHAWDRKFDFRQGGTFEGVRRRLGYLERLGVRALWLSPVLKQPKPEFAYTYAGYAAQDFLNLDERFASDGTRATAEREFAALVDEAHARGMYVVQDIVLNHAGRVFDYVVDGQARASVDDGRFLHVPFGGEPPVRWLNGFGGPRADWEDDLPGAPAALSPDDAVWPADLHDETFFRRRGGKVSDAPPDGGFVRGDFGDLRQLAVEYDATSDGQAPVRERYGASPVLSVLVRAYAYLVARYDLDGFRIDTVKYVDPHAVLTFGNALREFALSAGKRNFFTFGEIADDEKTIQRFVGRASRGGSGEGVGIDAALDFPLNNRLPDVAKQRAGVGEVRRTFAERKAAEEGRITSHGEAGRFFVTFLDNHDRHRRFNDPGTPWEQVTLGLAALFCLQGIPSVYYGTEQGLDGTADGRDSFESVREALWGKAGAFDEGHALYRQLRDLAGVRAAEPPLRYGRLYFREVSGNGRDFGHAEGAGGVLAFSRVLFEREVVFVANTSFSTPFRGAVVVDRDLSRRRHAVRVAYSNRRAAPIDGDRVRVGPAVMYGPGHDAAGTGVPSLATVAVELEPMEAQILVPRE